MTQDETSTRFRAWVRGRIALAKRLDKGECGGSYGDAMLILSALLSGRAADLWPGEGKDRRRFVEIWSTRPNPELNPNLISVPLLLDALEEEGNLGLVEKVRATNPEAFSQARYAGGDRRAGGPDGGRAVGPGSQALRQGA